MRWSEAPGDTCEDLALMIDQSLEIDGRGPSETWLPSRHYSCTANPPATQNSSSAADASDYTAENNYELPPGHYRESLLPKLRRSVLPQQEGLRQGIKSATPPPPPAPRRERAKVENPPQPSHKIAKPNYAPIVRAPPPFPSTQNAFVPVQKGDAHNEMGAARIVRKTIDEHGNTTEEVLKKGVEDFDFKQELGVGSYSTVVAAIDKQTLKQYAIKILDKAHIIKEGKVKYVNVEKDALLRLSDHPGIIQLYFTFQDLTRLFFVLDYAPNGELLQVIKRVGSIDELGTRYYASQIIDTIEYMHTNGVVHRDIKPENILLDYKMRVKITDFGTAKILDKDKETGMYPADCRASSFVGTAEYVSPELLSQKHQGKSCDIWALGCVIFQMIAGVPPFQANTQYLTFQKITKYQYNVPPGFPYKVRHLISHIFVGPHRRYKLQDIKNHEFFEEQDWSRKGVWGAVPPPLLPYKPSSASLVQGKSGSTKAAERAAVRVGIHGAVRPTGSGSQQVPRSSQPVYVPSPMGLQLSHPPQQPARQRPFSVEDVDGISGSYYPQSPPSSNNMNPGTSAALAALTHGSTHKHVTVQKVNIQTSGSYQQGQERIEAIRRAVRGKRTHGLYAQDNTSHGRRISVNAARGHGNSPSPEPLLPIPPMSQSETNWASVLVLPNERILKLASAYVLIGGYGSADDIESVTSEPSAFAKFFGQRRKRRLVMITTGGRVLVLGEDRRIRFEISLGSFNVTAREVNFSQRTQSPVIVINTQNKVLTLDDPVEGVGEWWTAIELAARYYEQAAFEAERSAHSAAAAATLATRR